MPTEEVFYVVAYDIPDDRRRARVAKELLNFGDRVQDSVFECRLTPLRLAVLISRLRELLEPADDLARLYRLCAECQRQIQDLGLDRGPEELPDILVI